jgi:hypothetical protein
MRDVEWGEVSAGLMVIALVVAVIAFLVFAVKDQSRTASYEAAHPCIEKKVVKQDVDRDGKPVYVDLCLKRL